MKALVSYPLSRVRAQAHLLFVLATSWVGSDSTRFTASLSTKNAVATSPETWGFCPLRLIFDVDVLHQHCRLRGVVLPQLSSAGQSMIPLHIVSFL